jgi:hypothetical protein
MENQPINILADVAKVEQRKRKNNEKAKKCAKKKRAAEAAKDVLIAQLQAEKAAAATENNQLALSLKIADQKLMEKSATIGQLTAEVRSIRLQHSSVRGS